MTLNTAPGHPHATGVAVYPALFVVVVVVDDFDNVVAFILMLLLTTYGLTLKRILLAGMIYFV